MKKIELIFWGILLSYLAIFMTGVFKPSFYDDMLHSPIRVARLLAFNTVVRDSEHPPVLWNEARDNKGGVVVYDSSKTYNGLTIFSSSDRGSTRLVDMQGETVHEWLLPFQEVRPSFAVITSHDPEGVFTRGCQSLASNKLWLPDIFSLNKGGDGGLGISDASINVPATHLYPDGGLLVLYSENGTAWTAGGVAKLDKNSRLLWKYDTILMHHSLTVGPDGKIYALGKIMENGSVTFADNNRYPCHVKDYLVILSPEGKELKRIAVRDAFERMLKRYNHDDGFYIRESLTTDGDLLHSNTVEVIPEGLEEKAPMLKAGNLLLSLRAHGILAILDPETEEFTWASYGPWHKQHGSRFLKDGSVVLFDNQGNLVRGATSRILRVDLNTTGILWHYDGTAQEPVFSEQFASVRPLPNGNVLVTETMGGRIFEVTPDHEVVWDYRNEDRTQPGFFQGMMVSAITDAQRFRPEDLPFLKQGKTP